MELKAEPVDSKSARRLIEKMENVMSRIHAIQ